MAFSTQKDFLKVAFLNNRLEPVCAKKPGVKLKSYLSSTDSRAWALSKEKQAHFLADLIACRNYVEEDHGEDGSGGDAACGGASSGFKQINICGEETASEAKPNVPPSECPLLVQDMAAGGEAVCAKSSSHRLAKESSTNVVFLQGQVNELRAENACLKRTLEDLKKKSCGQGDEAVIDERNKLKCQLSKMCAMEHKIAALKKRAMQADSLEKELKNCKAKLCELQKGSQNAMDALNCLAQKKGESDAKFLEQCKAERECLRIKLAQMECQLLNAAEIREKNEELCEQLRIAQCKLHKSQCLEQELINTRKRLCRSEQALEDYECQLHELMDVIEELESQKCFCCCTGGEGKVAESEENDGHIQDLITASKLTLDLVNTEFQARLDLQEKLKDSASKLESLKDEMTKEYDARIAELMNKLKECKADNDKLKARNEALSEGSKNAEDKIDAARENIRKSIEEIGRTSLSGDSGPGAEKCCEEAKQLREDLSKEKALWENKLKDMTALYEKARDEAAESKKSGNSANEEADKLKKEKEDADKEIKALNDVVKEQTELLASAKAELEKHRNDLTKCNEKMASLEKDIESLTNGKAELAKQLKDKENEVAALQGKVDDLASQLAACQQKLKTCSDSEAGLKNQLENLNKSLSDCKTEVNQMKDAKAELGNALAAHDKDIKAAVANLDKCKADLEALRKQMQEKIDALQAEKAALEKEAAENKEKLGQLGKLVSEIEAERAKNKQLEGMVNDFENKLKAVPKEAPTVGQEGQLSQAMDQLKNQLADETAKVNDLAAQLAKCQQQLAAGAPGSAAVSEAMKAADLERAATLTKIQGIHDNEKKDLSMNYDKEIEALKIANAALRDSLTKLKQAGGPAGFDMSKLLKALEELKKGACKCGQKKVCLTKLERICQKVIDSGIECLDIKELTFLHSEVYKAGLRLKPELLASENKNRCCKCTGFTCCLPSIPKEMEKKLINRILTLEKDVENANELLQRFKECTAKKPIPCKSGHTEKYSAFRVNDEINELLKLSTKKDDKECGSSVRELYRKPKRSFKSNDSTRKCD